MWKVILLITGDILDHYLEAGRIASEIRRESRNSVKVDTPILQLCEEVENRIRKKGGKPAFPCNVCVNDIAAHYSSPLDDDATIPKDSIVKVDIGVQVEGYIADTAITISLNPQYDMMVYAVNDALEHAIKIIRPKVKIIEVGRIIQKTIEQYGFKPIRNLSGHQLSRYVLHTGKSIPNVANLSLQSLSEGEVYAIEPFLTLASGSGEVVNAHNTYIYRFQKERKVSNDNAQKLLTLIKSDFKSLPFSQRWINEIKETNTQEAFNALISNRSLSSYPVLIEATGNVVAQAEHTIVVTRDGCLVTTQ